ncbi:MAG: hypothetical protein QXI33_02110 [Candidatus Pacearchaeota archaeon]
MAIKYFLTDEKIMESYIRELIKPPYNRNERKISRLKEELNKRRYNYPSLAEYNAIYSKEISKMMDEGEEHVYIAILKERVIKKILERNRRESLDGNVEAEYIYKI